MTKLHTPAAKAIAHTERALEHVTEMKGVQIQRSRDFLRTQARNQLRAALQALNDDEARFKKP